MHMCVWKNNQQKNDQQIYLYACNYNESTSIIQIMYMYNACVHVCICTVYIHTTVQQCSGHVNVVACEGVAYDEISLTVCKSITGSSAAVNISQPHWLDSTHVVSIAVSETKLIIFVTLNLHIRDCQSQIILQLQYLIFLFQMARTHCMYFCT